MNPVINFLSFLNSKNFFVLDIGTEAIKILALEKKKNQYVVAGNSLEYYHSHGAADSLDFSSSVFKKTLSRALETVGKAAGMNSKVAYCGPLADTLKEKIVVQSFVRKDKNTRISKSEEKEIYQQVFKATNKDVLEGAAKEFGILFQDFEMLSFRVLLIKIDGYVVPYLEGYKGNNLSFTILTVFLPKHYLEQFKKTAKDFKLSILKIIPETESLIYSFKKTSGGFIDIGGERTKIIVLKDGNVEQVDEISGGGEAFTNVLRQTLGLSLEGARGLKEQYSQGVLSEGVKEKITGLFAPSIKKWIENFELKLSDKTDILPNELFFFGGGSMLADFQKTILERDWSSGIFTRQPKVKIIYPKDIPNLKEMLSVKQLNTPQDMPSLLAAFSAVQNQR